MKRRSFILLSCLLILITCYFGGITVYGQNSVGKEAIKLQLQGQEEAYVENIKLLLNKYGCANAGVMLTKTFEDNENITYQISIHHKNLGWLTPQNKNSLMNEIESEFKISLDGFYIKLQCEML